MENRDKLRIVVIVELAVIIILSSLILMKLSSFNKPVEKIVQYEKMTETTEEEVEETTRKVVENKKKEETKDNKEVKETKKIKATETVKETEETEIEKEETIKIDIEKESNMITTKEGKKWVKVDEYTFFEIGRNEQYSKVSMYEILKEFGTKGTVAGKSGYMYNGKFWYEVAPSEFAEMK